MQHCLSPELHSTPNSSIPKTFKERALPLIRRGIWVIPLVPKNKNALIQDWPNRASNNPKQIEEWFSHWPDANVGCVATMGFCFLDDDRGDLRDRIERETGKQFPITFTVETSVKSTGVRGKHFYFKSTTRSLILGHRASPGSFDFQAEDGFQVVGPYSVHPSGTIYSPVDENAKIAEIPDWLCDWIEENTPKKAKSECRGDGPMASEDFDYGDWLDHYSDAFSTSQDGEWHVTSICPLTYTGEGTGHQHSGSTKTGFRFGRQTPEFHCFSTDPDENGNPHEEASFGDVVRHLNKHHDRYPGKIWQESTEADDDWAEIDDDDGAPEGTQQDEGGQLAAFLEAEPQQQASNTNEKEKCYRDNCQCGLEHPPITDSSPETDDTPEPAKERQFGKFPENAMYGYLGELARRLECPLGYAYPALLAVYASRWIGLGTRTVRPNLPVLLLGDTSTGKTRTQNRALATCVSDSAPRVVDSAFGSGEGLLVALGAKADKDIDGCERHGALPVLLWQDETRELFGKMAIDNSSLPYKLNRLFEYDDVGGSTKKGKLTAFAKASFLGGLTVESPAEFADIFGKGTVTGLYVRFIYGYAESGFRFDDKWEEFEKVPPEIRKPSQVKFTAGAFDMKEQWEAASPKERGQRLGQLALRVAAVTAAANGDSEVGEPCMRAALRFMEWQQEIRSVYKPSRADSMGGRYSEMIMEEAWRHKNEKGEFVPFLWREAYRRNRWFAKDSSQIIRQRDNLLKLGMLIKVDDPKRPKLIQYRAARWSQDHTQPKVAHVLDGEPLT
jgi:hypothetical protein